MVSEYQNSISTSILTDSIGRNINYLRLSVTDSCNLRCLYCMPPQGVIHKKQNDILTFEELLQIAQTSISIGIEKIRITGGEPLVRLGIANFIGQLSAINGLKHLALTTNGMLLDSMAKMLFDFGLQRLNVSIDSLRPEVFGLITRGGDLKTVLKGLDAAEKAGFPPAKINCVIMRGVNDGEILDFAEMSRTRGNSIRFIEYMPAIKYDEWKYYCISGEEILQKINEHFTLLPIDKGVYSGPSRDFKIPGAMGSIGVITAISKHFCSECNRIRVTCTGKAKGCLFSDTRTDLIPFLRPLDSEQLAIALQNIISTKPHEHRITREGYEHTNFEMSQVGG